MLISPLELMVKIWFFGSFFFFNGGTVLCAYLAGALPCEQYIQALFALIRVLFFCLCWPGPWFSYFKLLTIIVMTGACHLAQLFSVEIRSCKISFLGWPRTTILPISASRIAWYDRCAPLQPAIG
jgi:hypothetical protein